MVRENADSVDPGFPIQPLQQPVLGNQDRAQPRRKSPKDIGVKPITHHRDPLAPRRRAAQPGEGELEGRSERLAVQLAPNARLRFDAQRPVARLGGKAPVGIRSAHVRVGNEHWPGRFSQRIREVPAELSASPHCLAGLGVAPDEAWLGEPRAVFA